MVTLINTNPLGDVEIPALGLIVKAGEEFEVAAEHAKELLKQAGNYREKKAARKTTARKKPAPKPEAPESPTVAAPDRGVEPDPN